MYWMALAPVPTAATFRPVRSWSCSQRAEWNARPAKRSRPGRRGIDGRLSWPVAVRGGVEHGERPRPRALRGDAHADAGEAAADDGDPHAPSPTTPGRSGAVGVR